MPDLKKLIFDPVSKKIVDRAWDQISGDFERSYMRMPQKFMERTELSFHEHVKLLGFICLEVKDINGDAVEIGVWKGKSLAFIDMMLSQETRIIGIDPFEIEGQEREVNFLQNDIFQSCFLIRKYSQYAIDDLLDITRAIKILHIDGGHAKENVWLDFLTYERFLVVGGYIVFDDYGDNVSSPEVRPAVDRMNSIGLFFNYEILGQLPGFENSFVIKKKSRDNLGALSESFSADSIYRQYSPTVHVARGYAPKMASATVRYSRIGNQITVSGSTTVDLVGAAVGYLSMALPPGINMLGKAVLIPILALNSKSDTYVVGFIFENSIRLAVPSADHETIFFSGTFECA